MRAGSPCLCSKRTCSAKLLTSWVLLGCFQGSKLRAISIALSKGAKDVVTSGVVFWGAANPKDMQVGEG